MLRSAYFPDFKSGPKILLWGDASELFQLSNLFRAVSNKTGPLDVETISEAVDHKTIVIRVSSSSAGMRACDNGFEWALNPDIMLQFADMIDVLAESKEAGHQYLECGVTGEIVVMVSCGEYPSDMAVPNSVSN